MSNRPPASSDAVQRSMRSQATRNTKPEVRLRGELHRRGVRFRLHTRGLPGRPDIVLVSARVAVFVDGCFWHGCPQHFVAPKSNRDWWLDKIAATRVRDQRADAALAAMGWRSVHVWEHEDPAAGAHRLEQLWRHRHDG